MVQVFRDRSGMMGIVDYAAKDDMKYALRKLDDTEFKVLHIRLNICSMFAYVFTVLYCRMAASLHHCALTCHHCSLLL